MSKEKHMCPVCKGDGIYLMVEDAHRSAGWVPCSFCGKKGFITEEKYQELERKREISKKEFEEFKNSPSYKLAKKLAGRFHKT